MCRQQNQEEAKMKANRMTLIMLTMTILTCMSARAQTNCVPPPAGLVSWWPGDGNANDIQDGNNGTLEGGVTFAAGKVGQAFHFNGSSQFIQISNASNLSFERTDAFSLDAWIRTTESTLNHFIAAKRQISAPFTGFGLILDNGQLPTCESVNVPPPGAGV